MMALAAQSGCSSSPCTLTVFCRCCAIRVSLQLDHARKMAYEDSILLVTVRNLVGVGKT